MWRWRCDCGKVRVATRFEVLRSGDGASCRSCSRRRHDDDTRSALAKDYSRVKARHVRKGFPASEFISYETFRDTVTSDCAYCGAPPGTLKEPRYDYGEAVYVNGIDRIDSSKGYVEGNCAPCCIACNMAKGAMGYEEFIDHIGRIAAHAREEKV